MPRNRFFNEKYDDQLFIRNPGKIEQGYGEDDGNYQRQGYGDAGENHEDVSVSRDDEWENIYNQGARRYGHHTNNGINNFNNANNLNGRNPHQQHRGNGYDGGFGGYDDVDEEVVDSHFRPAVNDNSGPIVTPHREGRQFEIRPNYLTILPKFSGNATEEPYFHLDEYHAICSTIGGPHFTQEEIKMRLFQFSLIGKAKQWYHMLPSNSIFTWRQMQQEFLDEFYPMGKTSDAIENIRLFQQQVGEQLHEAWARYKELVRLCPHHEMKKWELIKAFCDGLTDEEMGV